MDEPRTYKTEMVSVDGRPLIEVDSMTRDGDLLELRGTASVYEATLLIRVRAPTGNETVEVIQASVGGPERGEWSGTIHARPEDTIIIGQHESEEGAASAPLRMITIPPSDA